MQSRGVLLYGVNNEPIDYIRLAIMNAKRISRIMDVPVSLVTDVAGSTHPALERCDVFDQIIIDETVTLTNNRTYRDTLYHMFDADFKNYNRPSAYDFSPYSETLLIDVDYIIQNDSLNRVWGSIEEIMINDSALSLMHTPLMGDEFRLNTFGIKMFLSTVVYFKKSKNTKTLFDMVKHIKENWEFYKLVYNFQNTTYRNDYAFSIAIHTLNGFIESHEIKPLPIPYILTATDKDQLYKVHNNSLIVFVNDPVTNYKFYVTRLPEINVHCMNKISLLRNIDALEAI